MKAWTDEECDLLITDCFDGLLGDDPQGHASAPMRSEVRDLIRAVVDEARREEREACAALFDGEKAAAWFHDIYQIEAHRRGDVRHHDSYNELKESTKEWDRVLARAAKAAILSRGDKEPHDAER